MDENNYLTPSKILKLIHLAEDKSIGPRTILNYDEASNRWDFYIINTILMKRSLLLIKHFILKFRNLQNPSPYTGESSSGILDLDRIRGKTD